MNALTQKLVTIAIDAPNHDLLLGWISNGFLPNLKELISGGYQCELNHKKYYRNENCWKIFSQPTFLEATGFKYSKESYQFEYDRLEGEWQNAFYSLGNKKRVCSFDLPVPFANDVNGIQINGWATEVSDSVAQSDPPYLITEIQKKHGDDPKLEGVDPIYNKQKKLFYRSYSLPSIYNQKELCKLADQLISSVGRRAEICCSLLEKESWDLFLTCFSESHTANHLLWHFDNEHPVKFPSSKRAAILEVTQAIDLAIGKIKKSLSDEQSLVVYTIDHTAQNSMDVPSMIFLPEILFRWSFNGDAAISDESSSASLDPIKLEFGAHWKHEVLSLLTPLGREMLLSPITLDAIGDPLSWNPASWYRECWPKMRAFALPSVSDGYIRLNVKGREKWGLIEPTDFLNELDNLTRLLYTLVNPRNGEPLVEKIIQIREDPNELPNLPADLIVCWSSNKIADVVDIPNFGRIGPVPFFRTGGHVAHGTDIKNFFVVSGPAAHVMKINNRGMSSISFDKLPKLLLSVIE